MSTQTSTGFIEEFFDREKYVARKWLQSEMNTLVETLFGRLKTKFVGEVESRENAKNLLSVHEVVLQELNDSTHQQNYSDLTHSNFISIIQSNQSSVNIKGELLEINPDFEQSLSRPSNTTDEYDYEEEEKGEEDQDCECDDCQGISMSFKDDQTEEIKDLENLKEEEEEAKDDDVIYLDHLPKRPRIDHSEADLPYEINNPKQILSQTTTAKLRASTELIGLSTNKEKQFTVIKLKCHLEDCARLFCTETDLNRHLMESHGISMIRCFIPFCNGSFDELEQLVRHIESAHHSITRWPCPYCSQVFSRHSCLYQHIHYLHYKGCFGCTRSECDFIGTTRQEMFLHFVSAHSELFLCSVCGAGFKQRCTMLRHMRQHSGVKPYCCRWPGCSYASFQVHDVLSHIRKRHFKLSSSSWANGNADNGQDPKQFLEVKRDLLEQLKSFAKG